LIQSPSSGTSVSWLATLTPVDETPIVYSDMVISHSPSTPTKMLLPNYFNLAVVVFSKRDVRDINLNPLSGIPVTGIVPTSERLGFLQDLTAETPDSWNLGTFNIDIEGSANVDAKVRVGDWLMLSRNMNVVVSPIGPILATRQRHKWYRVIGVNGENTFPRSVRVSGAPWSWTKHELDAGINLVSDLPVTAVTLVKDVLNVHERMVNLGEY
jgi:hypothetical protein